MVLASTAENDILSSQELRNKIKPTWFTDGTLPYFSNDNKPVLKFLLFSHSLKNNLLTFMPLLSTCGVWPIQRANTSWDHLNFLGSLISRFGEGLSSIKTKTTQVGGQIVSRTTFNFWKSIHYTTDAVTKYDHRGVWWYLPPLTYTWVLNAQNGHFFLLQSYE